MFSKIAFVSAGSPRNEKQFKLLFESAYNGEHKFSDYELKYSMIKPFGSQMEYSKKTDSQVNGLSLFIYEKVS